MHGKNCQVVHQYLCTKSPHWTNPHTVGFVPVPNATDSQPRITLNATIL